MNDKKLMKVIKKMKPTGYIPRTVSIYKLCEKTDKLGYFIQIRNRIIRELEQNENMGDYVRFSPDNAADLYLDDDGIFIFSDILMGYFEEQHIIDLWKYVRDLNKYHRSEYEFEQLFNNLTVPQLKKMIESYLAYQPKPGEEEARQSLIDRAKLELKKRKRIFMF